jgi:hypothetical protein
MTAWLHANAPPGKRKSFERASSPGCRVQMLSDGARYPVVPHIASAEQEQCFGLKGTKVIGFEKSGLAQSIYAELKPRRLNQPAKP